MIYRSTSRLKPAFKKKVDDFLKECDWIKITESYRTQERQNYLYAQGRTRAGRKVTWTLNSNHTKGEAIDIAFKGMTPYPSEFNEWKKVAEIAKKYEIDWGYNLWKADKPHFQDNHKPYAHEKPRRATARTSGEVGIRKTIKTLKRLWREVDNSPNEKIKKEIRIFCKKYQKKLR